MSNASANEQLMLELINRGRLDPLAEAMRYGIDLNQGLPAGTISAAQQQPLAMNNLLINSARGHSQWMIDTDTFSHTGSGGSDPGQRMSAAGYAFTGAWTWAENLAWIGTTGTPNLTSFIVEEHKGLFLSPGHRENTFNSFLREIGIGQVAGIFTESGTNYNSSMVTQNFAKSGSNFFVAGVAYNDWNGDNFYTVGEARSSVQMSVQPSGGGSASSNTGGAAGGYELGVSGGTYNVTFSGGGLGQSMTVQVPVAQNVKLDVVNGNTIQSSESLTVISGVASAVLLGVANASLKGTQGSEALVGNKGNNALWGQGGDDNLSGGLGDDTAIYSASSGSYLRLRRNNATVVSGPEGTDILLGVENAYFSDGTLDLGQGQGARDLNADLKADILWQNANGQAAVWLMNDVTPGTTVAVGGNPGSAWKVKGAADFDGDGRSDLYWQNDNGQAAIWFMEGVTPLTTVAVGSNPGSSWRIKGSGDFDANGKADILWQNDNGQAAIWLMDGSTPIGTTTVGGNPGTPWKVKGTGDFNGDGKADILWQNDNGQAAIWLMNGLAPTATVTVGVNSGAAWKVKGAGDFNDDGKSDILWQNDNGQVAIWLMNGLTPILTVAVGSNPGPTWQVKGASDFDGNGTADILFQNTNGQAAIWLMNGVTPTTTVATGTNPGTAWNAIASTA